MNYSVFTRIDRTKTNGVVSAMISQENWFESDGAFPFFIMQEKYDQKAYLESIHAYQPSRSLERVGIMHFLEKTSFTENIVV